MDCLTNITSTLSYNVLASYFMLQNNLLFITLRDETCLTDSIKFDFGCTRNEDYFGKKKHGSKLNNPQYFNAGLQRKVS